MTLGEIIIRYRTQHDLSQRQFAVKCGKSNGYIAMLEKGLNPSTKKPIAPNMETLKSIADAMSKDLDSLLSEIDENMTVEINPPGNTFSIEERDLIKKFRQLDERGKKSVLNILYYELSQTKQGG